MHSTPSDIIRAAIPGASDDVCQHVLWGRTPFPFKKLTARDIYKAASGYIRSARRGTYLCDHCHRIADYDIYECVGCHDGRTRACDDIGA